MAYQDDIKKAAALLLPWNKLSGCNILVTGATGLIGGCLVDVLMAHKSFNVVTKSVFSTKKLEALGWQLKGCMKDKMLATIKEAGNL